MLEDRAGGRVDLVAVLHAAEFELDLIDERAGLVVQLDLHVICLALAHTRVVQGDGLRLGVTDISGGRRVGGLHHRHLRSVSRLALALQDCTGVGVDLVLKLLTGLTPDLHLIVGEGLVQLGINLAVCHLRGG